MSRRSARVPVPTTALDQDSTLVVVLELSARSWLTGARIPGLGRLSRHALPPSAEALVSWLGSAKARAGAAGRTVSRVVLAYEAGRDGFWLARHLRARGVEVHVIQPTSVLVDRRARRAKTDALDVEMLMRTLLAWLRGEPGVCSMVPIPDVVEEDGRRPVRERQKLIGERLALLNEIDGVLATLGVTGYRPLRQDRRARLAELRTPEGDPLPANAAARIGRVLDRLELVMTQIAELERARDAVLAEETAAGEAETMIRSLARLRGIGAELATVLVREAYVRGFPNRKALGAYAGLTGTPFASGGTAREQGTSKAGNRRLRSSLVELAWLWLRYQPGSTLAGWFRNRTGFAGGRMRKVMVVALARKLLVALWRFCRDGVLPEGAVLKAVA
jgi:transposase